MIHARLDVCIPTHPKFVRAGPAAVGYWAAALAYTRDHLLDGAIPGDVIGAILGLGEKEARKLCERLVTVGLFARDDSDGYVLLKYSPKNETRADVEARREETRKRVTNYRSNAARNAVTSSVTQSVTPPLRAGAVPGSGSRSGSDQVLPGGAGGGIPDDVPVDAALLGACEMAGAPAPTRDDVQRCLANARKSQRPAPPGGWIHEIVSWMLKQKQFDARNSTRPANGKHVVQQAARADQPWLDDDYGVAAPREAKAR